MSTVITCSKCKHVFNDDTKACPKCEYIMSDAENKKAVKKANKISTVFFVIIAVFLGVWLFSGDEEKIDLTNPVSVIEFIKNTDNEINKVEAFTNVDGGVNYLVFASYEIAFSPIKSIALNVFRSTKKMAEAGIFSPNDDIVYFVHVPSVDKFGNEGTSLALKLTWQGQYLNRIDWKNADSRLFLNLASKVELSPIIHQDMQEFILDKDNQEVFAPFIMKVVN